MAYVDPNFPTKKSFKEAVKNGERVEVFSPGPFPVNKNGRVAVEGPHYPRPHTWYAECDVKDGIVVKVK